LLLYQGSAAARQHPDVLSYAGSDGAPLQSFETEWPEELRKQDKLQSTSPPKVLDNELSRADHSALAFIEL
jgi:hypothetical protein